MKVLPSQRRAYSNVDRTCYVREACTGVKSASDDENDECQVSRPVLMTWALPPLTKPTHSNRRNLTINKCTHLGFRNDVAMALGDLNRWKVYASSGSCMKIKLKSVLVLLIAYRYNGT